MNFNEYEALVVTLGEAMQELAIEAKAKKVASIGTDKENFQTGYLSAFHRVITLMQQQADIYEIPLDKIGLDKIKEQDLI
ncbi:hypothetical protein B1H58_06035 [Pantoea alhagi]|uniref:Uncharacterized protein n=1 Tax=Pantoea alhagi TaxID=1891675 RepID=A0A1W6B3F6_9GAMM|nr:hypothetical protein [Pantoea alhagi]ARJ41618.1 hypothetical protein B1H58_06035 [Pantoea alhagi]